MRNTAGMKLVFRIDGCGFSLPVADLVEIRENSPGLIDRSAADPERGSLGELFHRGEMVEIVDLGGLLKVAPPGLDHGRAILVLAQDETSWGLVADRIEGLFPETEFRSLELPPLVALSGPLPYDGLDVWHDELLVSCEAGRIAAAWEPR